ncbi:hypothetical protein LTR01_009165 [Friedmanniomyces endolithicus]|uniref:PD-(D/E)XK nuclease-like domain-containing protein n=1 Tax=Friedmanniomyces endolithicus TaxID=329885 RepID=A0AAN6J3Y0_9PEZI|nr:hypothetical protein LTR01_009165 [Friedmanniomyces endolithicus]KAK0302496.1 hypothetical protein LTR82_017847 [Friedmanniomyces endolithicus]KAK0822631.1 hypothetical protein LTR73_009171 [Friedmanniomyces endolithicus]
MSSVTAWLSDVENLPPPPLLGRKRKPEETTGSRESRRKSNMGTGGRGQRIPLQDAEESTRATTRRSPRREYRPNLPANLPGSSVMETAPSLTPTTSSNRSQSIATSTRSRRSSSPRKTARLIALPEPIAYIDLDPYNAEQRVPAKVLRVIERIGVYMRGHKILPESMREEITQADRLGEFDDLCFDDSGRRDAIGAAPPYVRVDEIRSDTQVCCDNERNVNEAGFNCESQHPIGKLAWRGSVHRTSLRWENITTADITPRSALLPPSAGSRAPDAARVDFAIVLEPSNAMKEALPLLEPLPGTEDASWGPTTMTAVARRPFACVLETKKSGGNSLSAEYQIGIWAYAIFKRLRLLLQDNGVAHEQLPCIPLLISNGERWEIHLAVQDEEHATFFRLSLTKLRENCALGLKVTVYHEFQHDDLAYSKSLSMVLGVSHSLSIVNPKSVY